MPVRTLPTRKALVALTLVVSGAVAGGAAVVATSASAAEPTPSASSSSNAGQTALTGDTLTKVKQAVLAKYPNATFDRVETDSDGVYEAHITTAAGERLTVELDKSFAITGTETGRGRGGRGGAGETALTGDTLTKVKEAVLAKYPNATFDRVETDSDGVYEAHITTAAGDQLTVELDKSYAITGTETGRGRDGRGGAGETALTGDTLTNVKEAVLAKYPNATFDRVETDSDGVYEAHITTAAGERLTVELDKSFAITGTE
jgi:uncharacterized membrane protein YkoI